MYLTRGPSTWAQPRVAPLYSVSFSSMYRNTDHWLLQVQGKITLTYAHNWDRSLGQTHLLNIWTTGAMDRTSSQAQVKLSQLLHSIYLKNRPLNKRTKNPTSGSLYNSMSKDIFKDDLLFLLLFSLIPSWIWYSGRSVLCGLSLAFYSSGTTSSSLILRLDNETVSQDCSNF
jgi:hypothetical protein